jgi:hypothetical protein
VGQEKPVAGCSKEIPQFRKLQALFVFVKEKSK